MLGLALFVWLIRSAGLGNILAASQRLGVGGFALVCFASMGLFLSLGAAWQTAAGEPAARIPLFTFARLVREAAADFLPLSQLGGLAAGCHAATVRAARVLVWYGGVYGLGTRESPGLWWGRGFLLRCRRRRTYVRVCA